jgi:hypothetical protein
MLGLADPWVFVAYLLCILSALLCVGWGVYFWNREPTDQEPEEEVRHWAAEEDKVEQEL